MGHDRLQQLHLRDTARAATGRRRLPWRQRPALLLTAVTAAMLLMATLFAPPVNAVSSPTASAPAAERGYLPFTATRDDSSAHRVRSVLDEDVRASYLDITRVRFANNPRYLKMSAVHPGLVGNRVDHLKFFVRNKSREGYALFVGPARDKQLLYFGTEEEGGQPVRCRGMRLRLHDAMFGDEARQGRVTMRIPQRCMSRTSQVRFAYTVWDDEGVTGDAAPGDYLGPQFTRWVRRG